MKKILLSVALTLISLSTQANNFNMPSWGNNNGSSWSMPSMNFGNSNNNGGGFNNGSNWSMPNMNFGNNNNAYNNGSNWSMPAMNWSNGNGYNNSSNWSMPNFNWNNNNQPYNFSNNTGFRNIPRPQAPNYIQNTMPNIQYKVPVIPKAPQFRPKVNTVKPLPIQSTIAPKAQQHQAPPMQIKLPTSANTAPVINTSGEIVTPEQQTKPNAINNH